MSAHPAAAPPPAAVPPTVRGLALVSLFNDFASEMVYPLLPALVAGPLGGGAVALGALDGAADLTSAVLKWVSGRLADRPGWRAPLILGGYATAVLVRPLMAVAGAAWQVVGFRVIDRIGKGLRTPPRDALIAEVADPAARGRAFGFHRAADHFGAVLGSLAAWWLLQTGADVRRVIEWSVVPGVVAVGVLAVVLRKAGRRKGGTAGVGSGAGRPSVARSAVPAVPPSGRSALWPPLLALAALVLARVPEALMLLRLQDLGVAVPLIPLVWAALHVVRSAGSYPGGRLTDRIGPRATVAMGGLLFAAVVAGLGARLTPAGAIAVFLAFGLVAGLTEAAERAMVARLAPTTRAGRGFGAYHAITGFAALPAGLVFGEVYQRSGGPAAFLLSAAAMVLAVVGWAAVAPRGR
ncbi:MAG TPA: MFS transporter [Gemmatimonadales bacterium]|nr:MFS transporter [Gemmatimonadales bacterium]